MPKPPEKPEDLKPRFGLLDLMMVVIIPGLIASVVQDQSRRIPIFFSLLVVSAASSWWAATVIQTFQIKSVWRRVGLHVFALLGLASFIISSFCVITFIFPHIASSRSIFILLLFPTVPIWAFMLHIENRRKLREQELRAAAPCAAPNPPPPPKP
ncbi:MAG TPA: hypothetical protein VGP72_07710 [Planctomycetota bacterium]|jgi:hypothetical protein